MTVFGELRSDRRAWQERRLLSDPVVRHNMAARASMRGPCGCIARWNAIAVPRRLAGAEELRRLGKMFRDEEELAAAVMDCPYSFFII